MTLFSSSCHCLQDVFSKTEDPVLFLRTDYYLQIGLWQIVYTMSKLGKQKHLIHPLCNLILTFQATF